MKNKKSYPAYSLMLASMLTSTIISAADFVIAVPYEITNASGFSWSQAGITCQVNTAEAINAGFSGRSIRTYAMGSKTFTPARTTSGISTGQVNIDVNVASGIARNPSKEKAYFCVIAIIKTDGSVANNREVDGSASTMRVKGTI